MIFLEKFLAFRPRLIILVVLLLLPAAVVLCRLLASTIGGGWVASWGDVIPVETCLLRSMITDKQSAKLLSS